MLWANKAFVYILWSSVLLWVTGHGISGTLQVNSLRNAVSSAIAFVEEEDALNRGLYEAGIDERGHNGGHRHMLGRFRYLMERTTMDSRRASVALAAITKLSNMLGMNINQLRSNPVVREAWMSMSPHFCHSRGVVCPPSNYRTADGSCNNLKRPTWGMSDRGQKRFLPSVYSDGIAHPRKLSVSGKPLPSPRVISKAIHRTGGRSEMLEPSISVMVMQWGQLTDHDLIDTPTMKGFHNSDITCCGLKPDILQRRSGCFIIPIPPHDPHFTKPCMNFVRSAPASRERCDIGRRQQLNQATSYVDASYIYGTDVGSMGDLRSFQNGYLKMNKYGMFTPSEDIDQCVRDFPTDYCMKSGDKRIHVVPGLASLQIYMLREHNRIATILGELNPHWNDERIFQETRKIMAAIAQHITYTEYLPNILGPLHMTRHGLRSTKRGYNTVYNPTVDSSIANVFGAAAFRFGHTLIPQTVNFLYKTGKRHTLDIEDTFNKPTHTIQGGGRGVDVVGRAMSVENAALADRFIEPGLVDNLFLDKQGNSFDLASLNIQRGRDHAIPGYNQWRKWCGLPPAFHFRVAPGGLVDMEPDAADIFSRIYSHPDDIDLFPGALSEIHVPGAAVGPTFACILSRQFRNVKFGDRFWYENNFRGTGFTEDQLNEIKTIRLSRILCNNMNTKVIARDVFRTPSKRNPEVPCKILRGINFNYWKEIVPSPAMWHLKAPLTALALLKY